MNTENDNYLNLKIGALSTIIIIAAITRIIPHPPNFTPILAIALFGGATFNQKTLAFLVPLAAMIISDIALQMVNGYGFHSSMLLIYALIMGITALGFYLRNNITFLRTALLAVSSTLIFFCVTNFSVWMSGTLYPATFDGLITCYIAAIPFYGNTLASTLLYSVAIFSIWKAVQKHIPYYTPDAV